MSVESKALDEAFANGPCHPRQRLVSASIDYTVDEVDCATVEFTDPDGKIAQCIRTAPTKEGDKLIFVPWTVRIGYWGQSPEEMTKLVGVPQMEFPDFPETGDPIVRLKILNSTVMLKTNTADGGDPANYLEPLSKGARNGPLYRALRATAEYYGLDLDLGTLDGVVDEVDSRIVERLETAAVGNNVSAEDIGKMIKDPSWSHIPRSAMFDLARMPVAGTADNPVLENDYSWLKRVAGIITAHIASGSLEATRHYTEYFNPVQPGRVTLADIKVIVGIGVKSSGKKKGSAALIFKCNYDLIMENGFNQGIPILDYRSGNRLLRSFQPSVDSSSQQASSWLATLFSNKRKQKGDVDAEPLLTDADIRSTDNAAEINPWTVDKQMFFPQSGPQEAATLVGWLDALKRHMSTDITGNATTYGIPKLIAGQLVGLAGLGCGPAVEVVTDTTAAEKQPFANYNRLYFVQRATHKMGSAGLYEMSLNVAGCAMDGSEAKVIKNYIERLKKGIEFNVESSEGSWGSLLGLI